MIEVYHLARRAFAPNAHAAFSGEGAALHGGRWNRKGTRAAYASSARSLAALEILAHVSRENAPADYAFAIARLDESDVAAIGRLPADWRAPIRSEACVEAGHAFLAGGGALALAVPSVIVPQEFNYLINPVHPRFAQLIVQRQLEPFTFDARLFAA